MEDDIKSEANEGDKRHFHRDKVGAKVRNPTEIGCKNAVKSLGVLAGSLSSLKT